MSVATTCRTSNLPGAGSSTDKQLLQAPEKRLCTPHGGAQDTIDLHYHSWQQASRRERTYTTRSLEVW